MDLRVLKTKKSLYESLIYLMRDHPFEEIKVSEICARAMTNRSTFYAHFEDKYSLLNSLILDLKDELKKELGKNQQILDSKKYYLECIRLLLDHVEEKKEIYLPLMLNNRNSIAMDMIYDTLLEDITNHVSSFEQQNPLSIPVDFVSHFYLGAISQIGMEWIQRKHYYSKEEILKYLEILIPDFN